MGTFANIVESVSAELGNKRKKKKKEKKKEEELSSGEYGVSVSKKDHSRRIKSVEWENDEERDWRSLIIVLTERLIT